MTAVDQGIEHPPLEEGVRRRDFIHVATGSFAAVGAAVAAWPFINQMNPSADVLAESTTEIDVAAIAPGQAIKTTFRKQPLFVRNLTKEREPTAYLASTFAGQPDGGIRAWPVAGLTARVVGVRLGFDF